MKFQIGKPAAELSADCFTLFLKYITRFCICWFGGWLCLTFGPVHHHHDNSNSFFFNNPEITSALIAALIIFIFFYRLWKKKRYGLLTAIEFNDLRQTVTMELLNTFTGRVWTKAISFSLFKTKASQYSGDLFGKQRIFELYEQGPLITVLNIDLTAWCRHEQLAVLMEALNRFC